MKGKIIFRADGDTNMGIGHIIRSLALADMLTNDFDVTFATSNQSDFIDREIIRICDRKINIVNEEDFLSTLSPADVVVVDGYQFSTEYLQTIQKKAASLVCVDDIPSKYFPADLIINHSPYVRREDYQTPSYTKFLLGWDYALLRRPFLEAAKSSKLRTANTRLLICMGGTDPFNLTSPFALAAVKSALFDQINIIHPEPRVLDFISKKNEHVLVHKNLSAQEMADMMLASDVLVCPSSTVAIEGLATKINLVTMYYVENQRKLYEYIIAEGRGFGIPIDRPPDDNFYMLELVKAQASFSKLKRSEVLIDGLQANRFLAAIKELKS